jgi:dipeptidase
VIVQLLETYGQGGNCGFTHPFFYDNSYLIGDRREAWVLETAGQEWAALKVKDYYSISNAITIHREWDRASASLVDFAVSRGWCRNAGDFDFARCYSDPLVTRFSAAVNRRQQTTRGIQSCAKGLGLQEAMDMLRDHQPAGAGQENLDKPILGSKVCMHLGFGPVRINQTVGSMVSQLSSSGDPSRDIHWFTATAAPCTGIFKPLWIDTRLPAHGPTPQGTYVEHALFWQHERLHRAVLEDYQERLDSIKQDRDALEGRFRAGTARFASGENEGRQEYSEACFQETRMALDRWLECVQNIPLSKRNVFYYRSTWDRVNRQARMPGTI